MYLPEGKRPPYHNTIARFRRNHLPEATEDLLNQMARLLVAHGEISLSLFVKPSDHEQKKKRKYKNDIGRRENMPYDAEKFVAPEAKKEVLPLMIP